MRLDNKVQKDSSLHFLQNTLQLHQFSFSCDVKEKKNLACYNCF